MESHVNFLKKTKEASLRRRILMAQYFKLTDPRNLDEFIIGEEEARNRKEMRKERRKALKRASQIKTESQDETFDDADSSQSKIESQEQTNLSIIKMENPHNDYSQNFIDTGERPQNYIRDAGLKNRFEEYPKLRELIKKKDDQIQHTNTPPMYLKCDLKTFDLRELDQKFDVILIDPPIPSKNNFENCFWNWDEIEKLELEHIAATRSFLWLWCGNGDGLEAGRKCLKKWGYRRCEDICWIKTNKQVGHNLRSDSKAIFQKTKEHCLMGIKGTVRRNINGNFIHTNIDTDIIIDEEPANGSNEKPVEIFHIIEHFCLGRRRLHLFGSDSSTRPGWLTLGQNITTSNYDKEAYNANFNKTSDDHLTGSTNEIEQLRPKSPPPKITLPVRQIYPIVTNAPTCLPQYPMLTNPVVNYNPSPMFNGNNAINPYHFITPMAANNNPIFAQPHLAPIAGGPWIQLPNPNNHYVPSIASSFNIL